MAQGYQAFPYRMGIGFPGTVTRMHPAATIEAGEVLTSNPPTFQGQGVILDTATGYIRVPTGVGDTGLFWGVVYRPYPFQIASASNWGAQGFGTTLLPTQGEIDIVRSGYVLVTVSGAGSPVKGGPVWLWIGVTGGGHVQGGFETASGGTSTIALPTGVTSWMSNGADPYGVAELAINV